jgi:hypothetical protein
MAEQTRRLTDTEREQRRARDRERLKQACEQLLSSDGWQRWVRARARNGLARYSVSNLCLILLANPHASFVAGFKAWLELGYCVRKGEHAIWIFAKRALLRLMRSRSVASSVVRGGARAGARLWVAGTSSGVCGTGSCCRLPCRIGCASLASDAKPRFSRRPVSPKRVPGGTS